MQCAGDVDQLMLMYPSEHNHALLGDICKKFSLQHLLFIYRKAGQPQPPFIDAEHPVGMPHHHPGNY